MLRADLCVPRRPQPRAEPSSAARARAVRPRSARNCGGTQVARRSLCASVRPQGRSERGNAIYSLFVFGCAAHGDQAANGRRCRVDGGARTAEWTLYAGGVAFLKGGDAKAIAADRRPLRDFAKLDMPTTIGSSGGIRRSAISVIFAGTWIAQRHGVRRRLAARVVEVGDRETQRNLRQVRVIRLFSYPPHLGKAPGSSAPANDFTMRRNLVTAAPATEC
jgi:hypothetical protein